MTVTHPLYLFLYLLALVLFVLAMFGVASAKANPHRRAGGYRRVVE